MTQKKNVSKMLVEKYRQFSNFCNYILSLTRDHNSPDGLGVGSQENDVKTEGSDWLARCESVDQIQTAHYSNTELDPVNTAINFHEFTNSRSPVQEGISYFVFQGNFRVSVEAADMAFENKRQALLEVSRSGLTLMRKEQ